MGNRIGEVAAGVRRRNLGSGMGRLCLQLGHKLMYVEGSWMAYQDRDVFCI